MTTGPVSTRTRWWAVLLTVLGACQVLLAASTAPPPTAVLGVAGGLVLAVCPWWRGHLRTWVVPAAALATVPFAALTWTSLVTPLVAVVALGLVAALLRGRRDGPPGSGPPDPSEPGPPVVAIRAAGR